MSAVVEDAHRVMDAIIGYLADIGEDLAFLPLMLRAPHEVDHVPGRRCRPHAGIHVMEREDPTHHRSEQHHEAPRCVAIGR